MVRLTDDQIKAKVDFIKDYCNGDNAATASKLDANANVSSKNIATLTAELHKDFNIQINRNLISNKIKTLFGTKLAKQYIRDIEDHTIYIHDETSLSVYCVSITMYPFLINGLKDLGGESGPPTHLESFCGSFANLVFAISSQFAGAVSTSEFLMAFDHFARQDLGKDYLETDTNYIKQKLQHVVYVLNQPAAARNYQSVFWNISTFDKFFFDGLFGNFVFPDGTKPDWESLNKLQKFFHEWFREERTKALLTFPVVTHSCLTDGSDLIDKDWKHFIAKEMSLGGEFFIYTSDSVDSLSSCCFSKDTKVLTKSSAGVNYCTFEELYNSKYAEVKRNFKIFHNGSWVSGNEVKLPNRKMFKITTVNNKEIIVSDNHTHPTIDGDKKTIELDTYDYLMFNNIPLDESKNVSSGLGYNDGFVIGAYLGDGSIYTRPEGYNETTYSVNSEKYKTLGPILNEVTKKFGVENINTNQYGELLSVKFASIDFAEFIKTWVFGNYAHEKNLNLNCLLESKDFRQGILDGFYLTDGGNSNRCYTTSVNLKDSIEVLITSLGLVSIIDVSDRTDEPCVIRGVEYTRNYPLWCIRWYTPKNKRTMMDIYAVKNNSIYFKIKSIEPIEYTNDIYCFEMKNQLEPYFTLPNGIITHNCRLRNTISDNEFSYSLGAGGVATGSKNVITININRVTQEGVPIEAIVERVQKYQVAFDKLFHEYYDNGMLTVYSAGFIDLKKQFLTIGINGVVEAAEYLGFEISNNEPYKNWLKETLRKIKDLNKVASDKFKIKLNTEFVPAEGLGVKNAKWDKADGLKVNRDCYNSYMYRVEDENMSVFEKMQIHGGEILNNLDGGSALHHNHAERLSEKQYHIILEQLAKTGCNYYTENVKKTICNKCGYIDVNTTKKCVKCGSEDLDYATRVIGYLKRVSSFSKDRQEEESRRHYEV